MNDIKERHLIKNENQLQFVMAGNARFTVENLRTLNRFSFKVSKSKKKDQPNLYFVSVDTNLGNRQNIQSHFQYNYLGIIFFDKMTYSWGRKSKLKEDSQYNKVFKYIFDRMKSKDMPDFVDFYHNNHCGRCGKTLRVPESIISGFGPECEKLMGLK